MKRRTFKKVFSVLLLLAMCLTMLPSIASASVGQEPAHTKKVTQNADGTYTIALDVTGDSEKKIQKVNVIVVLDASNSMYVNNTGNTTVTYTPTNANGNNLYGHNEQTDEYFALHREGTGGNSRYYYPWTGNVPTSTLYTGQRYTRQTANQNRMAAALEAIEALAQSLLANNGVGDNPADTVELALIVFANDATTDVTPTTSYDTFVAGAEVYREDQDFHGTNWDAALRAVNNVDFEDNDSTYVIFVTDGDPTRYVGQTSAGYEIGPAYEAALTPARAVVQGGFILYTIGAYGTVERMESLTNYAWTGSETTSPQKQYYYSAADTAALQAALNAILEEIELAGIGAVEMTDGTTSQVKTTSGTNVNMLTVDVNSYKYYRAGGTNDDGTEKYSSTANGGLGEAWTDAPPASLVDGAVEWDLSSVGVLENGVKYTVTFDCAPSQYTFDLIADLNNGKVLYNNLDANIKKYLKEDNGVYSLLTNTTTNLSYVDTREANPQPHNTTFNEQDPVATDVSSMTVKKVWTNTLDGRLSQPVTMNVTRDGTVIDTVTMSETAGWEKSTFIAIGQMTVDKTAGTIHLFAEGHEYSMSEPESISHHWDLKIQTVRPMIINGTKTTLIKVEGTDAPTMEKDYLSQDGTEYYKINGTVYEASKEANPDGAVMTATNYRRSHMNLTKVVEDTAAPADSMFTYSIKIGDPGGEDLWFSVYDENDAIIKDGSLVTTATAEKDATDSTKLTGYYYFPSGTAITVDLKAGWNLRIINLLTGSTYEIEETQMPQNFVFTSASMEAIVTDDAGNKTTTTTAGAKKTTGTVNTPNTQYNLTYTNDYQLSALKITKAVNGLPEGTTVPAQTSFVVRGPNNYSKTVAYSDFTDGSYTVEGLLPGTYTVTESGADVTDYTLTTSYTPTAGSSTTQASVTMGQGETGEVTVTNTYTRDTGNLTVTKVATGLEGNAVVPAGATFVISGPSDFEPVTVTYDQFTNNSYTLSNVPTGTYSVTESGASVTGYNLTTTISDPVAVQKGATATLTVTNAYEKDIGDTIYVHDSVTVDKVDGNNATLAGATFTLSKADGTAVQTYTGSEFVITTEDAALADILPAAGENVTLTLTETAAPEGYTADATGHPVVISAAAVEELVDGKFVTTVTYTMTIDNAESAEISNPRDTGNLTVTKVATGLEGNAVVPAGATFVISGPSDFEPVTVTYDQFTNNSYTLPNVPTGTYSVTESGADVTGYDLTTTLPDPVAVQKGATATLTVTNAYVKSTATLKIIKTASGATVPDAAKFTITGPEGFDAVVVTYQDLKDGNYSLTVPAGSYTVTENKISAKVSGYTLKVTGDNAIAKDLAPGATVEFNINNQYKKNSPPPPPGPPELDTENHFGYIIGYVDGMVRPEGNITRGEVVTIFFRMLTEKSRHDYWSTENDFTDVPKELWCNNAISTLANGGILTGYPDGSFKPNNTITRGELAAMASRFLDCTKDGYSGQDKFSDISDSWAREIINIVAENDLVNGYEDGTFRPDQMITRAETMAIINRLLKRAPDANYMLDDMIKWPDNMDTSKWYYAVVQEATNSHEYQLVNGHEVWTKLLEVRDWAALEKEWSDANSSTSPGEVVN